MRSVSSAAHLSGNALAIESTDAGYLYGISQFYGYDKTGAPATWVLNLYNFRQSHSQMLIDLLQSGTTTVVGRLTVTRATNGDLSGHIQYGGATYTISWHKISNR
jgi:hypothetical protein